jgi:hypothetical protein
MEKKGVSKIKHLSLRSKPKTKEENDLIPDEGIAIENSELIDVEARLSDNSLDKSFYEQTISFKNSKNKDKLDTTFVDAKGEDIRHEILDIAPELNKDKSFITSEKITKEINRVFQKTILVLVVDLIIFAFFVFYSLNLFFIGDNLITNTLITVGLGVLTVSVTSFFYILLSERKYLYFDIISKVVVFLVLNSFIGQGFSLVTIGSSIVIFIFSFLAYIELEKMQLGSRLFNLAIIATECRRILVTVSLLIFVIATFNQIIYRGVNNQGEFVSAENFISQTMLQNELIVDNVLIGRNSTFRSFSLNSFFISRNISFSNGLVQSRVIDKFTLRDYFITIYNKPQIITESEEELLNAECKDKQIKDCKGYIYGKVDEKLIQFQNEYFPEQKDIPLSSTINLELYRNLTKQFYSNLIRESSKDVKTGTSGFAFLNNLPLSNVLQTKYLIPLFFCIFLFIVLAGLRFIFNFLTSILLFLFWSILKLVRFVRVEIENVECEVVSI